MPISAPWLLVTPARNERDRLPQLAASLAAQTVQTIGLWVIVDDGSDDGTAECVDPQSMPFPVHVLRRTNTGGLLGASERVAFADGVAAGLERLPDAERVLKIDADLVLAPDHFAALTKVAPDVGVIGGVIADVADRSQPHHVRGGLRAYNRAAWDVAAGVPIALGWDVLDEVAIRAAGLEIRVVPEAIATSARRTGSSEGVLRGRRRGGVVARWTGYHPAYFALRLVRYSAMRPVGVGSAVMLWAYVTAGPGPFAAELKRANRTEQTARLHALARSPVRWFRENMRG
ncbi:MAG TPA: glycosyltransferase family A protein [Acidimicrobiales bacterium]|nr:glycosyltransferase family A protein [Acidimicrobiales bacterium]